MRREIGQRQARQEVQKRSSDLVIVAVDTGDEGDEELFLEDLLRWSAAPVLIAAPLRTAATDVYIPDLAEPIYPS